MKNMKTSRFPKDWDEERVRQILTHYESQTEEEAVAEDEAAYETPSQTVMIVPNELVPTIEKLIAEHQSRDGK